MSRMAIFGVIKVSFPIPCFLAIDVLQCSDFSLKKEKQVSSDCFIVYFIDNLIFKRTFQHIMMNGQLFCT